MKIRSASFQGAKGYAPPGKDSVIGSGRAPAGGGGSSFAQDITIFALQGKLVRGSQNITALDAGALGDRVNPYTGALEFVQADVDLPGSSLLEVALVRKRIAVRDPVISGQFGDWDLEVPYIGGTFSGAKGWVDFEGAMARCTRYGPPPNHYLNGVSFWYAEEFWQGTFLSLPNIAAQEVLRRGTNNPNAQTDGNAYPLLTRDGWQIRCLPGIANGLGEGFVAVSPQGAQYRFDWLASRALAPLQDGTGATMARHEVRLFASQVTDRFGNTVRYRFDTTNPWRLLRVEGSDGRFIGIAHTTVAGKSRVASATDGVRTWLYGYSGQGVLERVTLPDGSAWRFALGGLYYPYTNQLGEGASCDYGGLWPTDTLFGQITHPSGGVGNFGMTYVSHARNKVWRLCVDKHPPLVLSEDPGFITGYARWPKQFVSLTLASKTLSGPGLANQTWIYSYPSGKGTWDPCTTCPDSKAVLVTDPRGVVTRHVFGNQFHTKLRSID